MRNGWFGVVLCLVVGCGCRHAEKAYDDRRAVEKVEVMAEDAAAREEVERPATPSPGGKGLPAGAYRLKAVKVEAFATTAKNKPWDFAPPEPDLLVIVKVDDVEVARCRGPEDRVDVTCTFDDEDLVLGEASTITFAVRDRDVVTDDVVGGATLAGQGAGGTGIAMQLVPQRRVRFASITLAPMPDWLARHWLKVVGFVAIGAVVVGVAGARKRKLGRAEGRRACGACGAWLANHDRCSDCGAAQPAIA